MLLASGFSLVWLFLGRLVLHRFRQAIHAQGVGVSRVALIGNYDARSEKFINVLKAKPSSGYEWVGIVAGAPESEASDVPYLGESQDILELVQKHRLDTLFIASPVVPNDTILQILHACEGVPVQINVLPELSEFISGGTTITLFEGIPMLQLRETPMQGMRGIVKRLIDIVFSVFALIVLSPLMLMIAVIIRLTSPGKAVFRQERVGRAGKPFNIYKFRSMRVDAEEESWACMGRNRRSSANLTRKVSQALES